jgi:CelD/BcsL family acetyltransferase involved in cellulose biosynthesis
MYPPGVTPTLQADPDCARPATGSTPSDAPADRTEAASAGSKGPLRAERIAFDDIAPEAWDATAGLNPYATPFSRWAFQRAWWDAYGDNAVPDTLRVIDPSAPDDTVALVPLMHRHVVEASDATTHTKIRHGNEANLTPVAATACAIYFGASYHADYATLLAAPADIPRVADAVAEHFARERIVDEIHPQPWDVLDMRRLRSVDPSTEALAAAFGAREMAEGWTLNVEREDVCPVIRIPEGADLDAFLATLGKKERHEIRRKVRRAEGAGEVRLVDSRDPLADLDEFIDLHQRRWGEDGLFPATPGGDQSRVFIRRLFELFGERAKAAGAGPRDPSLHLAFLEVDGRRIGAAVFFETPGALLYYNAGVDPDARELSPGVVLLERLVRRAIEKGKCRVDLMRGDEPYKYEWGAQDEPIQRLLVRREAGS